MSSRNPILVFRTTRAGLFLVLLCSASAVRAQSPAPETAPPLFPGGGLISYDSIFTTRGATPQMCAPVSFTINGD